MQEARPEVRVLVADDDHVIAMTLSQILRLHGYETETVNSGEAAVAAAQACSPDVLISDVVMGGMTGIEAAARIAEINPGCVVILISGQAHTSNLQSRQGSGREPFEILLKPIHPGALLEHIAASMAMRRPVEVIAGQTVANC